MKYILDYTLGESFDYSSEKLEEIKAFSHRYEVIEVTTKGAEVMNLFYNVPTEYEYRTKVI